jgi:hypothetical protein
LFTKAGYELSDSSKTDVATAVTVCESFHESVERSLRKANSHKGRLPNAMNRIGEVVFYLHGAALLHNGLFNV